MDLLPERPLATPPTAGRGGWGSTARAATSRRGPAVRLLSVDGDEDGLLAALLFEAAGTSEEEARSAVRALPPDERAAMLAELVGERRNRRHRPGRGFEALRYRFEVVSDYGAFRDLQRHRMLTVQWQTLGPDLGAGVPEELEDAGVADAYRAGLERSRAEHARLVEAGPPELAPYALCLGYRIRYVLDMNAREAMHLIELRSGREGHPAYRAVAHALHAEIARVHPAVAAAMTYVDRDTEPRLERILSEIRTHAGSRESATPRRNLAAPQLKGHPTDQGGCPLRQRSNRYCSSWQSRLAMLVAAAVAMAAQSISRQRRSGRPDADTIKRTTASPRRAGTTRSMPRPGPYRANAGRERHRQRRANTDRSAAARATTAQRRRGP